jgi:hypothetical protein
VRGIVIIIFIWALLIGWVGKTAQARAQRVGWWALVAAASGALAFVVGAWVTAQAIDHEISTSLTLLSMLLPLLMMIAAMAAVGIVVLRRAPSAWGRKVWPVHFMEHGPGNLRIDGGRVVFEWPDGSHEIAASDIKNAEADGGCVRVSCDREVVMIPVGDGLGPQGTRLLSQQIAKRLVAEKTK